VQDSHSSSGSINARAQNYLTARLKEMNRKIDNFRPGDLICVHTIVREVVKDAIKERLQKFEGRCIARRGSGLDASYTVWAVVHEVGVRRTFPLYSYDVDLIRRGRVRRAKLNYFTRLRGKKARIREATAARAS
jgi:large subunit ribosomal protein L19